MKTINFKKTVFFAFSLIAAITGVHAIDGTGNLISGGITRTFTYHAPGATVDPALPVMIVMHGDGGTGAGIQGSTGFDAVADANNFLAIYPDAVGGAWNRYVDNVPGDAGLGNPGAPDDVLFISDLIDYLCATYFIDPNKVYASGHSAGGFMAYNLSIQLNNKVAAFAPVSASLWGDDPFMTNYFTNAYVPVPICHIHGDADMVVAYPDPDFTPVAYDEYPLSAFSPLNCGNQTYTGSTTIVAGAQSVNFCDGVGNKKVELVRINGMGHSWPAVAGFDAATYIWNFCNQYGLTTGINCATFGLNDDAVFENISLYPIPALDQINIGGEVPENSTVQMMDGLGRVVYSQKEFNQTTIDVSGLSPGIYFLTLKSGNATKQIKFIKN